MASKALGGILQTLARTQEKRSSQQFNSKSTCPTGRLAFAFPFFSVLRTDDLYHDRPRPEQQLQQYTHRQYTLVSLNKTSPCPAAVKCPQECPWSRVPAFRQSYLYWLLYWLCAAGNYRMLFLLYYCVYKLYMCLLHDHASAVTRPLHLFLTGNGVSMTSAVAGLQPAKLLVRLYSLQTARYPLTLYQQSGRCRTPRHKTPPGSGDQGPWCWRLGETRSSSENPDRQTRAHHQAIRRQQQNRQKKLGQKRRPSLDNGTRQGMKRINAA